MTKTIAEKRAYWAENAIRPFVIGRKAWLFAETPKSTQASGVFYSLIETAKANGVEPYAYLCHILKDSLMLIPLRKLKHYCLGELKIK